MHPPTPAFKVPSLPQQVRLPQRPGRVRALKAQSITVRRDNNKTEPLSVTGPSLVGDGHARALLKCRGVGPLETIPEKGALEKSLQNILLIIVSFGWHLCSHAALLERLSREQKKVP